jgi:hypothetical protein
MPLVAGPRHDFVYVEDLVDGCLCAARVATPVGAVFDMTHWLLDLGWPKRISSSAKPIDCFGSRNRQPRVHPEPRQVLDGTTQLRIFTHD